MWSTTGLGNKTDSRRRVVNDHRGKSLTKWEKYENHERNNLRGAVRHAGGYARRVYDIIAAYDSPRRPGLIDQRERTYGGPIAGRLLANFHD